MSNSTPISNNPLANLLPATASGDVWRWATITSLKPLRIRLDGDSEPLLSTPDTLTPVHLGERVRVQIYNRRATIIGTATGSALLLAAHPVGSYYWSSDPTSPEVLFGGRWERVTDKFIYAASTTHPAGSVGGSETHTLTNTEMPAHGGHFKEDGGAKYYLDVSKFTSYGTGGRGWTVHWSNEVIPATTSTGSGKPHNNMPPYVAAYCWHRIA